MVLAFFILMMVAAIPIMLTASSDLELCLFHSSSLKNLNLLIYNIALHLLVNGFLITISVVLCVKMIVTIYSIKKFIQKHGVASATNAMQAYVWLIVQAACKVLCWCPMQVLLILSISGIDINPEYVGWIVMLLMSVGSLANPILYTLRATNKKA